MMKRNTLTKVMSFKSGNCVKAEFRFCEDEGVVILRGTPLVFKQDIWKLPKELTFESLKSFFLNDKEDQKFDLVACKIDQFGSIIDIWNKNAELLLHAGNPQFFVVTPEDICQPDFEQSITKIEIWEEVIQINKKSELVFPGSMIDPSPNEFGKHCSERFEEF